MVAPIQAVNNINSPISIQFPMSSKRIKQIIKKIYDEEQQNYSGLSSEETEKSWERFRQKPKEDSAD